MTKKNWLTHDECFVYFVTMGLQHWYCGFTCSTSTFSLPLINTSCIDESRSLSIRDQLHTKWSLQTGKKMLMEMSLSFKTGSLQLRGSIDRSRTAAVSMSILIQCPSLIVQRDQTPFLPRSSHGPLLLPLWTFIQQQDRSPAVMTGQSEKHTQCWFSPENCTSVKTYAHKCNRNITAAD